MGESEVGEGIVGVAIGTKAAAGDANNSEDVAAKTSDALVEQRMMRGCEASDAMKAVGIQFLPHVDEQVVAG